MSVRSLVRPLGPAIGLETSVGDAIATCVVSGVDSLPVRDHDALVAVIDVQQLAHAASVGIGRIGDAVPLRVAYCFEDSGLAEVVATLDAAEVSRLVVLGGPSDHPTPVGVLAPADLALISAAHERAS